MKIRIRECDEVLANKIAKEHKININIVKFLLGRNIPETTIPLLVSNELIDLLPNDTLTNVKECAEVVNKYANDNNAHIYIFGDYDSDGINATYIMYNALKELIDALESSAKIDYYIPERSEGYGLNMNWCKSILDDSSNKLVITVDNGIAKKAEIDFLQSNNVEVLVTDHHEPQASLVPNTIIVDAHYNNDDFNSKSLCGAAVAYKVIAYLYQNIYGYDFLYLEKYIPHVAIATITDMMRVSDENIIFVNNGLYYINKYPYENMEYAPVSDAMFYFAENNKGTKTTPKDIAFNLGPQINSCGRMGDVNTAIAFMLSEDEESIIENYKQMLDLNDKRKDLTNSISACIEPPTTTEVALVRKISGAEGIIGNIANSLCSAYGLPTIIFTESDGNILSGSARCSSVYSLMELFKNTNYIYSFGGHDQAAGISILKKDYDKFVKSFNKAVSKAPVFVSVEDTIYVDQQIEATDINKYFINKYDDVLFFNELQKPVYYMENVQVTGYHTSKNNENNICFHIKAGNKEIKVWSWKFTETYKQLGEPKLINLVCSLEIFNGMNVMDIYSIEAA